MDPRFRRDDGVVEAGLGGCEMHSQIIGQNSCFGKKNTHFSILI